MAHSAKDIHILRETNQHLVFENDDARLSTVISIKSLFDLNEFGKERIESLCEHKCDRELIGHLISMLMYNITDLQQANKHLTRSMEEIKHQNSELTTEMDEVKTENQRLTSALELCGFNSVKSNVQTLESAMELIGDDNQGFDKLKAAVECFSSQETNPSNDQYVQYDQSIARTNVESPPSQSFNYPVVPKRNREEYENSGPSSHTLQPAVSQPVPYFPAPYVAKADSSSTNFLFQLLAQQQQYRSMYLDKQASN